MKKQCSKCGEVKNIERFVKHKDCKNGYASWCKNCDYEKRKKSGVYKRYRKRHRPQVLKWKKVYYERYKKRILKQLEKYRSKNKDKIRVYFRNLGKTEHRKKYLKILRKKQRQILSESYVKKKLIELGIKRPLITNNLIELKKEHILLYRNLKKLKEAQNESNHLNR